MNPDDVSTSDPAESPVGPAGRGGPPPTPRLTETAGESPEESVQQESEAVGDGPGGGLTPPEQAQ